MDRANQTRRTLIICALLGGITLAVFWPVIHDPFINLDDPNYVSENSHVLTGLSWENVLWAFRTGHAANWHPLTWISHMCDVQFLGPNPGVHHLVNLLFHAANSALLFLLLQNMTGAVWRSACVAALFALHPLHVESVAWIAERKDVLSSFFFIITIWAYAHYAQASPRTPDAPRPFLFSILQSPSTFYGLSLLLFALGLMCKPMLVTLPCVLLLLDYWPLKRLELPRLASVQTSGPEVRDSNFSKSNLFRLFLEKVPFFALAAASSVITFVVQAKGEAVGPVDKLPLSPRVANACLSYVNYLQKALWPVDLAVYYPHPFMTYPLPEPWTWPVIFSALVVVGVSLVALYRFKQQPYLVTGWFWYLGTLVPVIGLVQVGSQAMADRYTYIPLIGIFVWAVWTFADWFEGSQLGRLIVATAGVVVVMASAGMTRRQVGYWRDDISLFERALAITKVNGLAEFNLGTTLGRRGDYDGAVKHLRAAIEIMPALADAHYNLGLAFMSQKKMEEAIAEYETTLQLRPDHLSARNNLAAAFFAIGKPERALDQYFEAARLHPDSPVVQYNLGLALSEQGRLAESVVHLSEAVRLNPQHADALRGLGLALARQGKIEQAVVDFEQALRLRPDAEGHYNLGLARVMQGRLDEALTNYQQAVSLKPDWALALNDLAWLLATHPDSRLRNGSEAVRLAEKARELSGGKEARFWGTLDAAYAEAGRFDEAVATATKARELALAAGQQELGEAAQQRLALYRSRKPYRQAVPTAESIPQGADGR